MALRKTSTPPVFVHNQSIDFFSLFACLPQTCTQFASDTTHCADEQQESIKVTFRSAFPSTPTINAWLVIDREKGMLQRIGLKNVTASNEGFEVRLQVYQKFWKKGSSLHWLAFLQTKEDLANSASKIIIPTIKPPVPLEPRRFQKKENLIRQRRNASVSFRRPEQSELHRIASKGTRSELQYYLTSHLRQINDQDEFGFTPLMSAIDECNWENALFLCEQNEISFGSAALSGRSALHLLANKPLEYRVAVPSLDKLIPILIAKCQVDLCDIYGYTALHAAVKSTPRLSNNSQGTPATPNSLSSPNKNEIPSDYYHCLLCKYLLKNGALEVKDKTQKFPSDYAIELGLDNIKTILRNDENEQNSGKYRLMQPSYLPCQQTIVFPDSVEEFFSDVKSTTYDFIHSFLNTIKQDSHKFSLEEEGKIVQSFLYELEDKIRSYSRWKTFNEEQELTLQDDISFRIFKEIYTIEMNKSLDKSRDDALCKRFAYLIPHLTLKDLDVNDITPQSLTEAQQHLLSMQNEISPNRKMKSILNATQSLMKLLQSVGRPGSTDDLLPLLIICVLNCGLKTIASEIRFIESFFPKQYASNRLYFNFMSFVSSVAFLESSEEVDEIVKRNLAAKPGYRPPAVLVSQLSQFFEKQQRRKTTFL